MNRKVRNVLQWVLVLCLVTAIGVSPASAGRLLQRLRCQQANACPDVCEVVITCAPVACEPVCVAPIVVATPCCEPAPVCCPAPACCDSGIVSAPIVLGTIGSEVYGSEVYGGEIIIDSVPMIESPLMGSDPLALPGEVILDYGYPNSGMPSEPGTVIESSPVMPSEPTVVEPSPATVTPTEEEPPVPTTTEPSGTDETTAPADEANPFDRAAAGEMPADDAADDLFGGDDSGADTKPEPATETPVDDLFGIPPADNTPAADPADDLFGAEKPALPDEPAVAEPAVTEPAVTEPAVTEPADAAMDDLFGSDEPAAEAELPADATTSDAGADDLFGTPADAAPADATPAADAGDDLFGTPADAAPADAAPAADDDLFGTPADADAAPADAGDEPAMDDIFGAANDTAPADTDSGVDDIFGGGDAPADDATPASTTPSDDVMDDLFGDPAADEATPAAPAEEGSGDLENLFGQYPAASAEVAVAVVAVSPAKSVNPMSDTHERTWIDNTGEYQVVGRLFEINNENIRLLKDNGRTCTVPNDRLCPADAAYVDSIRKQAELARLAQSKTNLLTSN